MKRHLNGLILRYFILLIIALFGLPILTKILSFLTIKAVFIILNIFYTTNISEDVIIFNSIAIKLIRIITIAIIFERGYEYFDLIHNLSWYILSTLMVLSLWFINIYLFKIKSLPVYTDVKEVLKIIKSSNKHDKRNPK